EHDAPTLRRQPVALVENAHAALAEEAELEPAVEPHVAVGLRQNAIDLTRRRARQESEFRCAAARWKHAHQQAPVASEIHPAAGVDIESAQVLTGGSRLDDPEGASVGARQPAAGEHPKGPVGALLETS